MRISVSNLCFRCSSFEIMRKLPKDVGIEIFIEWGNDYYWDKALSYVMEKRKGPLSIHGPIQFVDFAGNADDKFLLDYMKWVFKFYKRHNAKFVVIHPNSSLTNSQDFCKMRSRSKRRIAKLQDIAKRENVILAIENMPRSNKKILFNMQEYIKIFEEIPGVKSLIDIGHAFIENWDIEKLLFSLKNRIAAYHLHDNNGYDDEHLNIGEGNFDWDTFFDIFKKYTPNATLVLEYEKATLDEIEESIQYIKSKIS